MPLHGKSSGPKFLQVSGADINSTVHTADFDTDWKGCAGAQRVCIWVNVVAASGTSPTLDIDLEATPDNGTTVCEFPQAANSQTVADLAQLTTTGNTACKWFELPPSGPDSQMKFRLECDLGGTTPSFTLKVWYSLFYPGG